MTRKCGRGKRNPWLAREHAIEKRTLPSGKAFSAASNASDNVICSDFSSRIIVNMVSVEIINKLAYLVYEQLS